MPFQFDTARPLYIQLAELLTRRIAAGDWPPGARLPSVRELAADMGVNPNTMQRALAELERAGLVHAERTAGRFVTEDAGCIAATRTRLAAAHVRAFAAEMAALGYTRAELLAALTELPDPIQPEEEPHG
ncbi:MAG: GntR family transcriptional regulator [Oscillospiraceae bacterium]|nr:GntR family transcriptional regulator [Oscillospiraceae bacterium]